MTDVKHQTDKTYITDRANRLIDERTGAALRMADEGYVDRAFETLHAVGDLLLMLEDVVGEPWPEGQRLLATAREKLTKAGPGKRGQP